MKILSQCKNEKKKKKPKIFCIFIMQNICDLDIFFSFFVFVSLIIIKLLYYQSSSWSPLRTEKADWRQETNVGWDNGLRWEALLSCHAEVTGPQSICNTAVRLADKHSPASESRGRIDDSLDSSYFRRSVCGDLCRAALVSAAALADGALNCAPQPTEAV